MTEKLRFDHGPVTVRVNYIRKVLNIALESIAASFAPTAFCSGTDRSLPCAPVAPKNGEALPGEPADVEDLAFMVCADVSAEDVPPPDALDVESVEELQKTRKCRRT